MPLRCTACVVYADDGLGGRGWRPAAVLSQHSPVDASLDPAATVNSGHNVPALNKLDWIEAPEGLPEDLRRTVVFYDGEGLRVVRSDGSVRALSLRPGLISCLTQMGLYRYLIEQLLAIYPDGTIARLVGAGGAILNTNLGEARTAASVAAGAVISAVANWQGRLWLAIGDTLFWSDVNNAHEWTVETDEGRQHWQAGINFRRQMRWMKSRCSGTGFMFLRTAVFIRSMYRILTASSALLSWCPGISYWRGHRLAEWPVLCGQYRHPALSGGVDSAISQLVDETLENLLSVRPQVHVTAEGDEISWFLGLMARCGRWM